MRYLRAARITFSLNTLIGTPVALAPAAFLCPFPPNSFDIVTGSFMLRSVQNMDRFFSEVKRVLKPQGKVIFLELTRPRNPIIWSFFYKPYLQFYIPWIGKFFSRHDEAYRFLSESVRYFMTVEELKEKFLLAQFKSVSIALLTFGAAVVVEGKNE
jgi:demethylmenaquinone methyltransferase/2-methoxy-6-polyprenyl-1,4-benzoquinol methylase